MREFALMFLANLTSTGLVLGIGFALYWRAAKKQLIKLQKQEERKIQLLTMIKDRSKGQAPEDFSGGFDN